MFQKLPRNFWGLSKSFGGLYGSPGELPGSFSGLYECFGYLYGTSGGLYRSLGDLYETSEELPGTSGGLSKNFGGLYRSLGKLPECSGELYGSFGDLPIGNLRKHGITSNFLFYSKSQWNCKRMLRRKKEVIKPDMIFIPFPETKNHGLLFLQLTLHFGENCPATYIPNALRVIVISQYNNWLLFICLK